METRKASRARQLSARVEELEAALRAQEDFISIAVHDLKTPLTGLLLQMERLEHDAREAPGEPVDPTRLRMVVAQTRQLAELIDRVLRAARLTEAGREVPLGDAAIDDVARAVWARLDVGDRRLSVHVEPHLRGAFGEAHLEQLFENLLENAVHYSPAGSEVRVRAWREGEQIHIEISDDGMGIFADDLERIFGRYQRGRGVDQRRFIGTGLGLFICLRIVERLGGYIWATSRGVGSGASFHILLPARGGGSQLTTG